MKLIKIEAQGFKSFANKISLSFDGGIVGIVGPNGSGKSNINDAIKWVLGEQSLKSLRGAHAEDIIFSGSKLVQASQRAQVSLTFDNSDQISSFSDQKIVITRAVERGQGFNQYFINGQVAKLKNIKEIAMESGIGKSSLAIISQGTISNIAEAPPEVRRGVFEEAAGISKYKFKKNEALRKLDSTTEALEKIKTIIQELAKQIGPLGRQANKAKIYLEKKAELKNTEISLIVQDLDFYGKKLGEINQFLETISSTKEDLENEIDGYERQIKQNNIDKLNLENNVLDLSTELDDISKQMEEINRKDFALAQNRKMIIENQVASSHEAKLKAMKEELENLALKMTKYDAWTKRAQLDITKKQDLTKNQQNQLATLNHEIDNYKNKILKLKAKKTILKDYQENKTNLFHGVKVIVENNNVFRGYHGVVYELLTIKSPHQKAIEAILGKTLQNIVMQDHDNAIRAVNFLKNNKAGRATFIVLDTIQSKGVQEYHLKVIANQPGFINVAANLVSCAPKYEVLKNFLLGHILVTSTIEDATAIAKLLNYKHIVVSLSGDIVRSRGLISGGYQRLTHSLVDLDQQIMDLKQAISQQETLIQDKQQLQHALINDISQENKVIDQLNLEQARTSAKQTMINEQFLTLKQTYEVQSEKKFVAKNYNVDFASTDQLESQKIAIETSLKAQRQSIKLVNEKINAASINKSESEKLLREILEKLAKKSSEKSQAQYILSTAKTRLVQEYQMTPEAAQDDYHLKLDVKQAREIVATLREQINQLGNVNVEAIETFKHVKQRYTKLQTSEAELQTAKETILGAIAQMDQIIIAKLDQTVTRVNQEFNQIFQTMFGGGQARVLYTDPHDLLTTGIDVEAQPPGKTIKNLRLFSGGEKAMIAISLLFSVLKSKPLPLCILDEVEAALDDANVVRFVNYLQELKQQTQFVVVTHRVQTMSRVDHLFGATMQMKGVTSFFTVQLADAKKIIQQ